MILVLTTVFEFLCVLFKYIEHNGGITTEDDYPYKAHDETCQTSKAAHHVVTISKYHDVPSDNPIQLQQAVTKGPVSIAIEVTEMHGNRKIQLDFEADKRYFQKFLLILILHFIF